MWLTSCLGSTFLSNFVLEKSKMLNIIKADADNAVSFRYQLQNKRVIIDHKRC